jgi:hypothetical protein
MPRVTDMFPSRFLKSADLKGARLPLMVRIVDVVQEEINAEGEAKKLKPVVYFAGKEKGLVLNVTNADAITMIAGSDDTDAWKNITVGLDVQTVRFKTDNVPAIRVVRPPRAHPYQAPRSDDRHQYDPPTRSARPPTTGNARDPQGWRGAEPERHPEPPDYPDHSEPDPDDDVPF